MVGGRRGNKLKKINKIYDKKFRMIPYFLRDFTNLLSDLEIKTLPPGTRIFDSNSVSRKFFVIKKGKIKLDDIKLSQIMGAGAEQTRVEGEWFGYESLIENEHWYMQQSNPING